ncbi:TM2 domain-containing protein [Pseudarthrobacter sp. J1738]|uniref:TM2 domain-containing protein n=1 Tax=Pseudarthrobacter sp. J1738 TaxID=3420446 RepID=UPI003D2B2AFE
MSEDKSIQVLQAPFRTGDIGQYVPTRGSLVRRTNHSGKQFKTAWLLSLTVGFLGFDRFYLEKYGTGWLKLLTLGGLGIWVWIDLLFLLANVTTDKDGRELSGYEDHIVGARVTTLGILLVCVLTMPFRELSGLFESASEPAASSGYTMPDYPSTQLPSRISPEALADAEDAAQTSGQLMAVLEAESTLRLHPHSRAALIKAVQEDGFSNVDATWAVDHLKISWNEEALLECRDFASQSWSSETEIKNHLKTKGFSEKQSSYAIKAWLSST